MYCVFYMEATANNGFVPNSIECSDLKKALTESETARQAGHKFVTIGVENPNMTGSLGVSAPPADYYWHKRRP